MGAQKPFCRKPFRENDGDYQYEVERSVVAESFVLVDKEGHKRADLCLSDDQPGLWLYDQNECLRAALFLLDEGEPGLVMSDKGDILRAALWINEGEANLNLFDKDGVIRVQVYASSDDEGHGVALNDKVERPCALLEVGEDGEGSLDFYDKEERRRATVRIADEND